MSAEARASPARKQVTVLFCDVADYTSRSVAQDPEDLADDIGVFQTLCVAIAAQYHGRVVSFLGDGILVLFGHPYASEFDPEHAVRAGLGMVERMARNNASEQWRRRAPLRIRVGIATGLVVVGEHGVGREQDELIFGQAPNLAARMQDLAAPNTVVAALRTRRLVGSAFKFRDLGEHRVKGFEQPVSAWQVLGARARPNHAATSVKRGVANFVSRAAELQRLRDGHAAAVRGRGRVIHLTGEAGIGKSRLIRVFEKTLRKQDLHRLRITCSPYFCGSSFKPIVDETHRWLQIDAEHPPAARRENIRAAMLAIALDDTDEHALFNELLDIPMPPGQTYLALGAQEKHRRTVRALAAFVIKLSRKRPLLLVVEDLHWADSSTLQVLESIISQAAEEKLFAVLTSRTGFCPPWPPSEALTELSLGGLNAHESERLIASLFEAQPLPAAVAQTLIRKSAGVPLFLEETSRYLLDRLRRDHERPADLEPGQIHGQIRDTDEAPLYGRFAVPDTLQDSLNARLDQLGETKDFAQLAAAFGSDFRYSLIRQLAARHGIDADAGMDALLETGLLAVMPDQTEDRYAFRHALFQDAAYHSLLKKTRQRYHAQIAELLRRENPDIEHQRPAQLAYHYSRSERIDRAVDLWLRAGQRAIAQSAIDEALQHLTCGLKLNAELAPVEVHAEAASDKDAHRRRELALQLTIGVALTARAGYHDDRVTEAYQRALTLTEAVGNAQQTWTALYGCWRCLASRAEFSKSLRVAMKLKSLSEKSRDPKLMMAAYGLQGMTRMVTGKLGLAQRFYDQAAAMHDRHRDRHIGMRYGQDPYVTIRGLAAVNQLLRNNAAAARAELERSLAAARAVGHPYTVAETLRVAAMYQQIAGDLRQLRGHAEEAADLAKKHGFDGLLAAANIFLAFCQAARHAPAAGTGCIERNLKCYENHYGMLFLPYFRGVLAEARLAMGDFGGARRAAEQALAMVDRFGEEWSRPALISIKTHALRAGHLATSTEIARWQETGITAATAQGAELTHLRLLRKAPRYVNESLANSALYSVLEKPATALICEHIPMDSPNASG